MLKRVRRILEPIARANALVLLLVLFYGVVTPTAYLWRRYGRRPPSGWVSCEPCDFERPF